MGIGRLRPGTRVRKAVYTPGQIPLQCPARRAAAADRRRVSDTNRRFVVAVDVQGQHGHVVRRVCLENRNNSRSRHEGLRAGAVEIGVMVSGCQEIPAAPPGLVRTRFPQPYYYPSVVPFVFEDLRPVEFDGGQFVTFGVRAGGEALRIRRAPHLQAIVLIGQVVVVQHRTRSDVPVVHQCRRLRQDGRGRGDRERQSEPRRQGACSERRRSHAPRRHPPEAPRSGPATGVTPGHDGALISAVVREDESIGQLPPRELSRGLLLRPGPASSFGRPALGSPSVREHPIRSSPPDPTKTASAGTAPNAPPVPGAAATSVLSQRPIDPRPFHCSPTETSRYCSR